MLYKNLTEEKVGSIFSQIEIHRMQNGLKNPQRELEIAVPFLYDLIKDVLIDLQKQNSIGSEPESEIPEIVPEKPKRQTRVAGKK